MVKKSIVLMFILTLIGCGEDSPVAPTPVNNAVSTVATNVSTPTPGDSPTVNDSEPAPNLVDPVDTPLYSIVGPGGCLDYAEYEWTVTINEEGYRLRTASFHENDAGCSPTTRKGGGALQIVSEMNPGPTVFEWHGNQACGRYQADIAIGDEATESFETIVGVVINTGVDCVAEEIIEEESEVEEPEIEEPEVEEPPVVDLCLYTSPGSVTITLIGRGEDGIDAVSIFFDENAGQLRVGAVSESPLTDLELIHIDVDQNDLGVWDWDRDGGPNSAWILLDTNIPSEHTQPDANNPHGIYSLAVESIATGKQYILAFTVTMTNVDNGIEMIVSGISLCPYGGEALLPAIVFPAPGPYVPPIICLYPSPASVTVVTRGRNEVDAVSIVFDVDTGQLRVAATGDPLNGKPELMHIDADSDDPGLFDWWQEGGPRIVAGWEIVDHNMPGGNKADDIQHGIYSLVVEHIPTGDQYILTFTVTMSNVDGGVMMTVSNISLCTYVGEALPLPTVFDIPSPRSCMTSSPATTTIQSITTNRKDPDTVIISFDVSSGLVMRTSSDTTVLNSDLIGIDIDEDDNGQFDWQSGPGSDWKIEATNLPDTHSDIRHGIYHLAVKEVVTGDKYILGFTATMKNVINGVDVIVSDVTMCPYDDNLPAATKFDLPPVL